MLHAAIVEDVDLQREELEQRLGRIFGREHLEYELTACDSGEAFLAACEQTAFGVVFLDIYMGGISGMEVAERLRELQPQCVVIFLTTSADHAIDGFRVRAFHYLMKPCTEEELERVVLEYLARFYTGQRVLKLIAGRTEISVPVDAILWAEHYQHQVHLHLRDGRDVATRMAFRSFGSLLAGDRRFFICSQGSLVNLDSALDFDGKAFAVEGGWSVPVSRPLQKEAKAALTQRLVEKLLTR